MSLQNYLTLTPPKYRGDGHYESSKYNMDYPLAKVVTGYGSQMQMHAQLLNSMSYIWGSGSAGVFNYKVTMDILKLKLK